MSSYFTTSVTEADAENCNPLLNDIRQCSRCDLGGNDTFPCPGFFFAQPPLDVLLIGMSPGKDENKVGRPFVGRAGKTLMRMVHKVWDTPPSIGLTNVVRCHTPENRAPKPLEIAACDEWLWKEIATASAAVIFLLGNSAIPLAFPGKKIGEVAGEARAKGDVTWIACYHPAAILHSHNPVIEKSIMDSLRLGKELLGG